MRVFAAEKIIPKLLLLLEKILRQNWIMKIELSPIKSGGHINLRRAVCSCFYELTQNFVLHCSEWGTAHQHRK